MKSWVVGETPEACLQAFTFIEENAQYQIEAEALGGVKPFAPGIWEKHLAIGNPQLVWKYWRRIIEGEGIPL